LCEGKMPNSDTMQLSATKGGMFSCGWPLPTCVKAFGSIAMSGVPVP
jgi:hypothetical protein